MDSDSDKKQTNLDVKREFALLSINLLASHIKELTDSYDRFLCELELERKPEKNHAFNVRRARELRQKLVNVLPLSIVDGQLNCPELIAVVNGLRNIDAQLSKQMDPIASVPPSQVTRSVYDRLITSCAPYNKSLQKAQQRLSVLLSEPAS